MNMKLFYHWPKQNYADEFYVLADCPANAALKANQHVEAQARSGWVDHFPSYPYQEKDFSEAKDGMVVRAAD